MHIPAEQIRSWVAANFTFQSRKNGAEICICNPFDGDGGFNFNINVETGRAHDWRGDEWAGGEPKTFLTLVMKFRDCAFRDAYHEVTNSNYIPTLTRSRDLSPIVPSSAISVELPPGCMPLATSSNPKMAGMLLRWLASRGVDSEMVVEYDLRHLGDDVIWPYYEYGELVYWQSRSRVNKVFRFPHGISGATKGMFLYSFDLVTPGSRVVVVEALFGVMTLGRQCVATGGAALTKMQARKLRALNPREGVVLAPDYDAAGIKSLLSNYSILNPYFKLYYSLPPTNTGANIKDWNELVEKLHWTRDHIKQAFETNVKPLDESAIFQLSCLLSKLD